MTEQQTNSAMVEETKPRLESAPLPEQPPQKNRSGIAGIALGAIAIAIALALGGGLYSYGKHQSAAQTANTDALATQLIALRWKPLSSSKRLLSKSRIANKRIWRVSLRKCSKKWRPFPGVMRKPGC